jgi:hypothetical protein
MAALSGGFEAGREPCAAVEQVAEGVEFADAPFGGGGQLGLYEREVGERVDGPPAASRAALLDLDRPDRPVGFVIGEDVQVRTGREPQDQVLEAEEPAGDAAGVFRGGGAAVEVAGQPGGGERPVAGDEVVQDGGVQGGLPGLDAEAASRASMSRQAIRDAHSCWPGSKSYRPLRSLSR